MNKANYIGCILVLLLATGCGNSYKTALVKTKSVSPSNTTHLPLLVDLIIDDYKTNATFSCKTYWGIEYAKEQAVAAALKKSNADILYEPQFLVENTGSFFNVEVSGHPAHYKNFRQASAPSDTLGLVSGLNIVQPSPRIINTKYKGH